MSHASASSESKSASSEQNGSGSPGSCGAVLQRVRWLPIGSCLGAGCGRAIRAGQSIHKQSNGTARWRLQHDGTYRLNTRQDGDIILSGSIVEYDRSHLSFQPTDIVTPRDYWLRLRAHVTAQERASGRVLLDREVVGHTTLRVTPDLASAERQAVPLAAEDLARNIAALLTEGAW